MGVSNPRNIGAHGKQVALVVPQAIAAGNVDPKTAGKTLSYDRQADNFPQSMALKLNCGKTSSNPSVASMQVQVYDSPDDTTYSPYVPPPILGVPQTTCKTAAIDCSAAPATDELDVDLSGADRYISVKLLPLFTGGTSPAITTSVVAFFGGAAKEPL